MSAKKKQNQAWKWFEYLGEGMDREPRTTGDMIKMGFKSVFRLVVFICWLALKPVRWILKKIFRRGDDDMFGRGKKKENNPYMNPNAYAGERIRFGAPPAIPAHMADQGYPPPYSQPQPYPQQPYPPAQPQAYPQPAPAPPAQQEQSYEQQRMVQNPFIELDKSFEQIQDAFSNVHARILDMEKDLDELFKRTNQIMGVQGRPERTVRFRN
jgi:hypothetical protein